MKKIALMIIILLIVFGFSLTLSSVISVPAVPGKYDFSKEQMYIEEALDMNEDADAHPIRDKTLETKVKDYIKKVREAIVHMQGRQQMIITVSSVLTVFLLILLTCVFFYSSHLKRRAGVPMEVKTLESRDRENGKAGEEPGGRGTNWPLKQGKVKKYEQSNLTAQRAEQHLRRLLRYMEEEKPYLEFELTLGDIARELSIPQKELSQVINERLNKNFCTFLNEYRIREARRLLLENTDKKLSVLDIAYESGFNCKTSFNVVFKKHLQMTPTQFRKTHYRQAA